MKAHDRMFLKQARLGYSKILYQYHRKNPNVVLGERKHLLDKNFVFTDEAVHRLSRINSLLTEKGQAAYEHAVSLEKEIVKLMNQPDSFIMDYEMEFELSFFADKKYSHIPDLEGNPFYEYTPIIYHKLTDKESRDEHQMEWLFKTDHRETLREDHPLSGFSHCYLFHDLIDHSILSYQDLLDIEDIWIDVQLTIQNHIRIELEE